MSKKTEAREPLVEPDQDSDRDTFYFKIATVRKIVEAAGGLGAAGNILVLQNDLDTAAGRFNVLQACASFPVDRVAYLSKLEYAMRRVLTLVAGDEDAGEIDPPKGVPQHILAALDKPQYDIEFDLDKIDIADLDLDLEKFQQLIVLAAGFRDRASAARMRLEKPDTSKVNPRIEYPKTLSPEAWLICKTLPEIYEQHFRPFRVSAKKGVGGPGVKFIQHCLAALEVNKKPAAIKKMLDRYPTMRDIDA